MTNYETLLEDDDLRASSPATGTAAAVGSQSARPASHAPRPTGPPPPFNDLGDHDHIDFDLDDDPLAFQDFILRDAETNLNSPHLVGSKSPQDTLVTGRVGGPSNAGGGHIGGGSSSGKQAPQTAIASTATNSANAWFWSIAYYQRYFDVDPEDVVSRARIALWPFPPNPTFHDTITANPDLYGPLWITTTLVVACFMTSAISQARLVGLDSPLYDLLDAQTLSVAATLIYTYLALIPLAVWGVAQATGTPLAVPALDAGLPTTMAGGAPVADAAATTAGPLVYLYTLYGYAMTPWLPVAVLCLVFAHTAWIQWMVVGIGLGLNVPLILPQIIRLRGAGVAASAAGAGTVPGGLDADPFGPAAGAPSTSTFAQLSKGGILITSAAAAHAGFALIFKFLLF